MITLVLRFIIYTGLSFTPIGMIWIVHLFTWELSLFFGASFYILWVCVILEGNNE